MQYDLVRSPFDIDLMSKIEVDAVYRDVHKKLTHLFYNFHGTKRRKHEFADTKR